MAECIRRLAPNGSRVAVKWVIEGVYEGVLIRVIVQGSEIVSAFPI